YDPRRVAPVIQLEIRLAGYRRPSRVRMVDRHNLPLSVTQPAMHFDELSLVGHVPRRAGRDVAQGVNRVYLRVATAEHSAALKRTFAPALVDHGAIDVLGDTQRRWRVVRGLRRRVCAVGHSGKSGVERYRSPRSGSTTTTSLPAFSGRRAAAMAPTTAAPQEMPQRMPSSLASRRVISKASSSRTAMTSSMTFGLSTSGIKPAPIPWILCGPGRSGSWCRDWLI